MQQGAMYIMMFVDRSIRLSVSRLIGQIIDILLYEL